MFTGAHSHIRGLGLDDALEPRQVVLVTVLSHCVRARVCVHRHLRGWLGRGQRAGQQG